MLLIEVSMRRKSFSLFIQFWVLSSHFFWSVGDSCRSSLTLELEGEKRAQIQKPPLFYFPISLHHPSLTAAATSSDGRTRRNRPQRPQLLLVPPPPPPPLSPPSPTSGGTKEGERRLTHRETYVHTPSTDSNRATTASLKGTEG